MKIRAVSHVHSEWSYDGSWALDQLATLFKELGYRAVLMTEHDRGFDQRKYEDFRRACHEASSSEILMMPGIEYSNADNSVHVLVWGDIPFLGENLPTLDLLQRVHAHGGVSVLAHPTRKQAWAQFQPSWGQYLSGIEVWNRKTDQWAPSVHAIKLGRGSKSLLFVGLDFHRFKHLFPFSLTLEIDGEVSESNIVECLRRQKVRANILGFHEGNFRRPAAMFVLQKINSARKRLAGFYRKFTSER